MEILSKTPLSMPDKVLFAPISAVYDDQMITVEGECPQIKNCPGGLCHDCKFFQNSGAFLDKMLPKMCTGITGRDPLEARRHPEKDKESDTNYNSTIHYILTIPGGRVPRWTATYIQFEQPKGHCKSIIRKCVK